ncbi:MAG: tRNA epoxyqueuosine(34) reductase QueG [bacterium]|nr:tRNA epoxyqueuosine(34) reductase QueG [bacterium]
MELTLEGRIVARARELGFDLCGIAPAAPRRGAEFRAWLKEGYGGRMTYLNRSVMRRTEPERILKGVRTVISVGQSYFTGYLPEEIRRDPSRGIIASYAWGDDYHVLMAQALQELGDFVREHVPGAATHWCVDAQPVLERDAAERAGLGFIGKNTMLIHPKLGSQFFLGEILTTADLTPSPPPRLPSCGSCTKCLDVCPTHAFPVPYVLDARLCVSYLTIELSVRFQLNSEASWATTFSGAMIVRHAVRGCSAFRR